MKVNIKHLGLLASITIAILFAGCSDKDVEDPGRNGPDNNERISAQITLKQNGGYTRIVLLYIYSMRHGDWKKR